jgi:NAD(P)-dependent dehydrogenase (short-subunit alcohol dehydrogenase family)
MRLRFFQELSKSLESATGKLYAVKCDISNESEVLAAFKWVKDNLGGVDILINNAAVLTEPSVTSKWLQHCKYHIAVRFHHCRPLCFAHNFVSHPVGHLYTTVTRPNIVKVCNRTSMLIS